MKENKYSIFPISAVLSGMDGWRPIRTVGRLSALLLLATAALLAQSKGINTTVYRTVVVPADEAQFSVTLSTFDDTSLRQILEILADTSVKESELVSQSIDTSAYDYATAKRRIRWSFHFKFVRPVGLFPAISQRLYALRRSFSRPSSSWELTYGAALNPSPAAIEAMRQRLTPQLIADGRRKARSMADALGLTLGPLASVGHPLWQLFPRLVPGGLPGGSGYSDTIYSNFYVTYSLTVRFDIN